MLLTNKQYLLKLMIDYKWVFSTLINIYQNNIYTIILKNLASGDLIVQFCYNL